jgi:two-component system chemotaxis sensor kinase CheA
MVMDESEYHQAFFEESLEGLEAMEAGLLRLGEGSEASEGINTIFLVAHSMKGGAGMLGFSAVAELARLVETVVDRRRNGRVETTREVIDVLLESVDCLRDMLSEAQHGDQPDPVRGTEIEQRLRQLIDRDPGADAGIGSGTGLPPASADGSHTVDGRHTGGHGSSAWRIHFTPQPGIFRTGDDPGRILRELAALGEYQVEADISGLPTLEGLDHAVSYCAWVVELRGTSDRPRIDRADIDEAFEWVQAEADIVVLPIEDDHPAASAAAAGPGLTGGEEITRAGAIGGSSSDRSGAPRRGTDSRCGDDCGCNGPEHRAGPGHRSADETCQCGAGSHRETGPCAHQQPAPGGYPRAGHVCCHRPAPGGCQQPGAALRGAERSHGWEQRVQMGSWSSGPGAGAPSVQPELSADSDEEWQEF